MSRRRRITIAILVAGCILAAGALAYRHHARDRRVLGAWREVSGGTFGPRRVLTFLPDGTVNDAAWNEAGIQTGSGIEWQWWTRGGNLFLRGYAPPPASQSGVTTLLKTAFDEFYRWTSRQPQNDEVSFRIVELGARRIVLDDELPSGEMRRLVLERVD